ncbi:MAG: hypothetical protein IKT59_02645 [Bacteroidales bacterium]|nr:hypothetical protein [Bacteroidales bacterium]
MGGIEIMLKSEDVVFDRVICTLEKLEDILIVERNCKSESLIHTVIGSCRDFHDDSNNSATSEMLLEELLLQCHCLDFVADYEDTDIFNTAVTVYMKALLEWYAGRTSLSYYDEVDSSVIPIMLVLHRRISLFQLNDIFQAYVHSIPTIEHLHDERFQIFKAEVEEWIYGRRTWMPIPVLSKNEDVITSHRRGNAVDGYKRIMSSIIILSDTSSPAKILYKIVDNYLPQVAQQVSHINEETIDRAYEMRTRIR